MNILKTLFPAKKIAIFLLAIVSLLILVACGETTGTPYGTLGDDTYLDINGYTVTERQLYNQLRTSSLNRLTSYIDEIVFSDVEINTEDLTDFEVTAFEQEINTALFSSATVTPKAISDYTDGMTARRILSFADSFVITNPEVNKANLIAFLDAVVADVIARAEAVDFDEEADFVFGYVNKTAYPTYAAIIDALVAQYEVAVAKKVYAKGILGSAVGSGLEGEINDEDNAAYISEAHAVTYYKNNVAGRYDTSVLIVKFENVVEQETARYKYAIKSNSRGDWYQIPNISDQAVIDILNAGSGDANWKPYHQKVSDILVNDLQFVAGSFEAIDYRTPEFATYYSKYVLNSTVDAELLLNDSPADNKVLEVFLQIYDDLNDTTYAQDYIAGTITRAELEEAFTYEYTSPILANATELRNQVYNMDSDVLYDGGNGQDEDGNAYAKPYSRQVQTIGGTPYLLFLFNDNRTDDDDVLDESNPDETVFADNPHAQSLKAEAYEALVEQRLTTAYINEKVNTKLNEATIDIYDPIIRELYKNQREYKGSTGFNGNDVLATVNGVDLTVDEYFNRLEKTLGLSTALDIVLMRKLRENYGDEITEADMADFRKQLETQYVNPFLADQYASAGFPATMGLDNFLLVGFGAWAQDGRSATADAIDKIYVQTTLRELFQEDLTVHFEGNTLNDNIYSKFAQLAKNVRDNQVAIQASHLLIYTDLDNDGQPDNPNELEQVKRDKLEALLPAFITEINKRAKLSSTIQAGLQAVVTAYGNGTRYELSSVTLPANPTPEEIEDYINSFNREDVWVPFKKAGFKLKYEALNEISNQTNFPTQQSGLDVDFYEYAMKLANYIKAEVTEVVGGEEPTKEEMVARANAMLPLYAPALITTDNTIVADGNSAVRSGFGYHLIVATSYVHPESARLEAVSTSEQAEYTSKIDNPYETDKKLVGYNNDSSDITWEQIMIYLEESKEETGVVTLPTSVQTTITKYFATINSNTMYNSSYVQLEIAFLYIFENDVQLTGAMDTRLQVLRQANFNQFFNYAYFEGVDGTGTTIYDRAYNEEYAKVYGDFFTVLHG